MNTEKSVEFESLAPKLAIFETVIYASNLDETARFYEQILGLELYSVRDNRSVFFKMGDQMLLIFNPQNTSTIPVPIGDETIPMHGTSGEGHLCFRVAPHEMEVWLKRLASMGVEIESQITWRPGVESIYFRDPAGNSLEITVRDLWFGDDDES